MFSLDYGFVDENEKDLFQSEFCLIISLFFIRNEMKDVLVKNEDV